MKLIFYTGDTEKACLPIILNKLGYNGYEYFHIRDGDARKENNCCRHIKGKIKYMPRRQAIKRIFILLDSEGKLEEKKKLVKPIEKNLNKKGLNTKYKFVDPKFEKWLLNAREAIEKIIGEKISLRRRSDPYEALNDIFKRYLNRSYRKVDDGKKIAEKCSKEEIQEIRETCKDFDVFLKNLEEQ